MKADCIAVQILEALPVQMAGKVVRVFILKAQKKLQGINIRKVLISGGNQFSLGAPGDRRFDICGEKSQAWPFDEADRNAERTAQIQIALQFVNEFNL